MDKVFIFRICFLFHHWPCVQGETCPREESVTKTLWAEGSVHKMHEKALTFVHFLVQHGAKAVDELERILAVMNALVADVETDRITEEHLKENGLWEDFEAMQLFTSKATGGRFSIDPKVKGVIGGLDKKHAPTNAAEYIDQHMNMRPVGKIDTPDTGESDSSDTADDRSDAGAYCADDGASAEPAIGDYNMFGGPFRGMCNKFAEETEKGQGKILHCYYVGSKFKSFIEREMETDLGVYIDGERDHTQHTDCILVTMGSTKGSLHDKIKKLELKGRLDIVEERHKQLMGL